MDSLYFEPIVQHYVKIQSKVENLPYFGLGTDFFLMDVFYKVKEIPLEEELDVFLETNKEVLERLVQE